MPKITDIKRQQKRDQLFSIFIDGKFSFSLTDLEVSTSGLRVGQELTAQRLAGLTQQAGISKAMGRAYHYLSFRRRSSHELVVYLKSKDYDDQTVAQVLERLQTAGLIDDHAFAQEWVEGRGNLKSLSRRRLEQELRAKYIDKQIIDEVLGSTEADSDEQSIRRLIEKKRLQMKYPDERQLIAYLSRQGFGYTDIKRALSSLDDAE